MNVFATPACRQKCGGKVEKVYAANCPVCIHKQKKTTPDGEAAEKQEGGRDTHHPAVAQVVIVEEPEQMSKYYIFH